MANYGRTNNANDVVFNHPSRLHGLDHPLPPGAYVVETREEIISGLSFVAYRRLRTCIILPFNIGANALRHVTEIDPDDLVEALARDHQNCPQQVGEQVLNFRSNDVPAAEVLKFRTAAAIKERLGIRPPTHCRATTGFSKRLALPEFR